MSIEGFHVVGEQDHSRVAVYEETEFLAHKLFLKEFKITKNVIYLFKREGKFDSYNCEIMHYGLLGHWFTIETNYTQVIILIHKWIFFEKEKKEIR